MQGVRSASGAKLFERQLFSGRLPIFCRGIIFSLTFVASKSDNFPHGRSPPLTGITLLDDLGHHSRTDSPAAFADSEVEALVHRNGGNKVDFHVNIVTWHDHLGAFG